MTLAEVLAKWDVVPHQVRLIQDRGSAHWSVRSAEERFVLRRYGSHRDLEQVLWEQDLLRRVSARGWPVACAIGPAQAVDGHLYSLFPFIGGSRIRGPDDDQRRRCGRLLAEFHVDTATITIDPRPGVPKIWQFDAETIAANPDTLRTAVGACDAALFAEHAAAVGEDFERFGVRDFPRAVVHGDFAAWNLRFTGGRLSALYDFDPADVDARAADVACGRRGYHDVFVDGYREVLPMTDEELGALASLWTANVLRDIAAALGAGVASDEWNRAELDWCRTQLDKTVP